MINVWFSKCFMTGGYIYHRMVYDVLKEKGFQVAEKKAHTPYLGKGFTYVNALFTYFLKTSKEVDIDIMDYRAATWCSKRHRGKRVIIMFHFDLEENRKKRKQQFFFNRFLRNAKGAKIVVNAQYWKDYLENLGLDNIEVIYCAYDVEHYKPYLSKKAFLKKHGLPDKPIIYLGKNSRPKTWNAYQMVKSLEKDYLIITTGPRKDFPGPHHLDLDFEDYCSLLYCCGVTLLLPQFSEGWSRIAHESLICGSPVIGNGKGGMRELLEKTNQPVLEEQQPEAIIALIKQIIASGKRIDKKDSLHARTFDMAYFGQKWEKVISEISAGMEKGSGLLKK